MASRRLLLSLAVLATAEFPDASPKTLTHQPAVIHLDFGDILGAHAASSNSWVYPRSLLRLPVERAVFCTNSRFPQDTFCEVGVVIERDYPDQFITEVNMSYPHPTLPKTTCSVRLSLEEDNLSKSRLIYQGFQCEPQIDKITDAPSFKIADVEHLTIRSRQYKNENYVCWHEFKNARLSESEADGVVGGGGYEEPNVKFVHDGISCISAISFNRDE